MHFPAESENVTVRQYLRLKGGVWSTRDVTLSSGSTASQWYSVALNPTTIDADRSSYIIEAKTDYMKGSTVLKSGSVKTFYIPVRPKINRSHVAAYDITGALAAQCGAYRQNGSLYVGQKAYLNYTYTSSCSWSANYNFGAFINGPTDFILMNTAINNSSPIVRTSSHDPYVVPNTVPSLPIEMATSWYADAGRTREATDVPIPVIKADAELKEIKLIDVATGAYVTGNRLTPKQRITPQYVYRNNSSVKIFVEGYDNDKSRLGGSATAFYEIPASSEILVNGKTITIPNETSYSIWGGVFLEGAGQGGTAWESNGKNNTKTVKYDVGYPLKIQYVAPNALYREDTEVVTSFIVQNISETDYKKTAVPSVRFTASSGGKTLYTTLKTGVVIPALSENLVYFKWTVPSGLDGADITLKASVIRSGVTNDTTTFTHGSEVRPTSQPPDTTFVKAKPSDFKEVPIPTWKHTISSQWSEWVYENDAFEKKTYGIQLTTPTFNIVPDVISPSREYNVRWFMASGYGYTLNCTAQTKTLTGKTTPPDASYTAAQAANLLFPEFGYSNAANMYRSLDSVESNKFCLPVNPNAKDNARLHFTPLWFPDGKYQCQGLVTDVWTPAGMIFRYSNTNVVNISGSAYDDWYVGR